MSTSLYRTSLVIVASAPGVLAAPVVAADIYTWTDERGTTVISDTAPKNPNRVTDFQVVVRDEKKSSERSGSRKATPTEQKLLDRIDDLERQARAQPSAQTYSSAPAAPSPPQAVSYYTPPPAPPAYDPYYYDYPGYYPGYYPSYYSPFAYSWPGAIVVSRGFAGHRHHHGHFGQRSITTTSRGGFVARGRR